MHTQREETIEHVRTNSAPFISIIWICYAIACHAFIKVFIYVHFCCCCCCWISIRGWMFAQHTHIHTYDIPHFIALLPATTKFGRWIVPVKKCRNNFICLCFWPDCTALKCSHELSLRVYSTAELIFFLVFFLLFLVEPLQCIWVWITTEVKMPAKQMNEWETRAAHLLINPPQILRAVAAIKKHALGPRCHH